MGAAAWPTVGEQAAVRRTWWEEEVAAAGHLRGRGPSSPGGGLYVNQAGEGESH